MQRALAKQLHLPGRMHPHDYLHALDAHLGETREFAPRLFTYMLAANLIALPMTTERLKSYERVYYCDATSWAGFVCLLYICILRPNYRHARKTTKYK